MGGSATTLILLVFNLSLERRLCHLQTLGEESNLSRNLVNLAKGKLFLLFPFLMFF